METKVKEDNVENLVIIGSGPAGYTAAIYAVSYTHLTLPTKA